MTIGRSYLQLQLTVPSSRLILCVHRRAPATRKRQAAGTRSVLTMAWTWLTLCPNANYNSSGTTLLHGQVYPVKCYSSKQKVNPVSPAFKILPNPDLCLVRVRPTMPNNRSNLVINLDNKSTDEVCLRVPHFRHWNSVLFVLVGHFDLQAMGIILLMNSHYMYFYTCGDQTSWDQVAWNST